MTGELDSPNDRETKVASENELAVKSLSALPIGECATFSTNRVFTPQDFHMLSASLLRHFLRKTLCRSLIVALALAAVCPLGLADDPITILIQSKITRVQPMTGIVLWSENEFADRFNQAISLEFRYCGYNEVVQSDGSYDFARIDAVLDEIASRNHQAVLRFYFCYVGKETTVPRPIRDGSDYRETIGTSEGQKTHFCDWSNPELQDFTLEFYDRLAKRYDKDPRIAFLQTGFGLWAEYHIYDGPRKLGKTFPSKAFQAKFLQHLDKCFSNLPWSISVDAADSEYSPLEDDDSLLKLGFGVFDDSFLCKSHARENAINWAILQSDRWQRQPGGGELSYYTKRDQRQALNPAGPYGTSLEEAAKRFHISYMIGNDQPRYQTMERIRSASSAMGYRFRITNAVLDGTKLQLTVTNEGVAPLYRDAFFSVGGKRAATTLRGLLPGEIRNFEIADVKRAEINQLQIHCDHILPTQKIEFAADLP